MVVSPVDVEHAVQRANVSFLFPLGSDSIREMMMLSSREAQASADSGAP